MPNNDSHQHVVKTTSQWEERAVEYWVVPRGCLCVELTPEGKTKLKVGEGNKYFSQLPYICDHGDLSNYYTKEETDTLLENLNRMAIVSTDVYDSKDDLPLVDNKLGDVRFVKSNDEDPDIYIWNDTKWISTKSDTDLSDYVTKSEFEPVKDKVDEIYPKAHTHANKDTLDNITQEKLDEIDELAEMYVEVKGDISDLKSKSHTHSNKSLLDSITQSSLWTQPDRDKFNSLHNYDDTQVKFRLVTLEEKAHTHSNKTVLDGITQEKLDEIDELAATYVIIKQDLVDLKEKAHTHANMDLLDGTTASFTTEQQAELYRLSQISTFIGAGPTWDGVFGYVPAPTSGQQTYFLRGDGTWAKVKSGGDKYKAGEGITILSGEVISDTFPFEIFPKAATVTQYVIYGNASGVGEPVSGHYEVPIKVSAPGYSDRTQTISIDDPLYAGDYIDFQRQVFVHYRTNINSKVTVDPQHKYRKGIFSDGHIDYYSPGSWGDWPVVSIPFEIIPGATYEISPWNASGSASVFKPVMYLNLYDADMNRTRTIFQEYLGNTIVVTASNEKYMRKTMLFSQQVYQLYPVETPCQLYELLLYPNVINTVDVLTTNKPNEIYVEVVPPDDEEIDPDNPMSEYTGIIYNDGVIDVTQEDPNALNELTFHYRDNVDKTITIPSASVMEGATDQTDGEEGLVPAPLAGDENKFLRGDGTWVEVSGGASYIEGNGIELIGTTEVDMNFDYTAFVNSLTGAYNGTLTKNVDGSITITPSSASGSWTVPDIGGGSPSPYKFNVGSRTTYKLTWDSGDDTVNGSARVFENAAVTTMYIAPQSNHELTFTTSDSCSYISIRFEETDLLPMTISNVKLYRLDASAVSINAKLGDGLHFDSNNAITVDEMTGATSLVDGSSGTVPTPTATDNTKFLRGDATWVEINNTNYVAGQGVNISAAVSSEYTQVEYLKSTGTQYILTDIVPDYTMRIVLDVKFGSTVLSNVKATRMIFGYYNGGTTDPACLTVWMDQDAATSNTDILIFYDGFKWSDNMVTTNSISDVDVTTRNNLIIQRGTCNWGSYTCTTLDNAITVQTPATGMAIFAAFNAGNYQIFGKRDMYLYSVKIYDSNSELIHNLIPVKRNADDEPGLYDLKTYKFYTNMGTGVFTVGSDVGPVPSDDQIISAKLGNGLRFDANEAIEAIPYVAGTGIDIESYAPARLPVEYQEVEYIASDGVTQNYINTGIHQPMTAVIDMKYNTNATQQYMGWSVTGKNRYFGVDTYGKYNLEDTPGSVTGIDLDVTERRTITVSFRTDQASTMTIEGQTITNFTTEGSDVYTTNDFLLFTLDKTDYFSNATIYEVTIYDTNFQPIFHGIPCYRVSDDVSGLYDLVTETFKPSIGGNLAVGPDVVPNNSYKIINTGLLSVEQDQLDPGHLTFETIDGDVDVNIPNNTYTAGAGIVFTAPGMTDLGFDFDAFVAKITSINNGTKTVDSEYEVLTLTATGDDCYTAPYTDTTAQNVYTFPIVAGHVYRLTWDSSNPSVPGRVFAFENVSETNLHWVDQSVQDYLEFTAVTSGTINFRFGVQNSGNTISYSNIHFYEMDDFDPNTTIVNADIAKGLEFDSLDKLQVKLGDGLHFDSNDAIEIDSNLYYPGQGIEFGGETLIPTEFNQSAFINVIGANNGNISKTPALDAFTLTATNNDCFTDHYDGYDGYYITAEPNTKYRVSWESTNGTSGNMFVFEVRGTSYTGVMYIVNNANTNVNIFTTSSTCTKLSLRFGVASTGNSERYSNITFDKVVPLNNVITAKLGDGLSFDSNGAITADSITPQYVRVNTSDSYVLLHTKPSDWDDSWYNYYTLEYDELTASPPDWDPTKHYKYENDNYVLGSPGDTFVSTTWYDKHYKGLDPNTPVVFDSDVYYTDELHLIEDGETFDTAFKKVNEAIEHIERLEQDVQFLHDNKVDVRETVDPERIEFYYS